MEKKNTELKEKDSSLKEFYDMISKNTIKTTEAAKTSSESTEEKDTSTETASTETAATQAPAQDHQEP